MTAHLRCRRRLAPRLRRPFLPRALVLRGGRRHGGGRRRARRRVWPCPVLRGRSPALEGGGGRGGGGRGGGGRRGGGLLLQAHLLLQLPALLLQESVQVHGLRGALQSGWGGGVRSRGRWGLGDARLTPPEASLVTEVGGSRGVGVPHPPKEHWAIARVHKRQSAQKRRKKFGSSVAYKTIGTFLSQR